ncbi:hypothetical protein D3C72_988720 [compost metagenome]
MQELDLRLFPTEVQFRHAARRQNPVSGVEHQPRLTHLQQSRAHIGVLSTGIDLQRQTAECQAQRHRHRQQNIDQDRLRGVPLAVTLEVTDVLVNLVKPRVQILAPPQQGADQQGQGQEQQRSLSQAVSQFTEAGCPWQGVDLAFQALRHRAHPFQIQRLVAWNPEHLLIERRTQTLRGAQQLFLIELQGDRLVEHGAQFAVQPLQQIGAGVGQIQQVFAQLRGDLLRRLRR